MSASGRLPPEARGTKPSFVIRRPMSVYSALIMDDHESCGHLDIDVRLSGGAHRNYVVSHAFHGFIRSVVDEKTIADAKFVRDDGSDAGRTFQLQPKIADDDA